MSSLNEIVIPDSALNPDSDFSGVMVTLIPIDDNDGPCAFVDLPTRATPYTVGEVLLCSDLSPSLFEAIGGSAVKFWSARDLRVLSASDVVESGEGICIERCTVAPDLSDIRGCNTTHSGILVQPKHGNLAGANTTTYRVPPVREKKKRRFF